LARHYQLDPQRSTVVVKAQSTLHEVTSRGAGLHGFVAGDFSNPETLAEGSISFPLANMSFGDRVRDFALKRHLNIKQWPEARFVVTGVQVEQRDPWRVQVLGKLSYRDHVVDLAVAAVGTVTETTLEATAEFTLKLPEIGITPPRFLLLKVADTVELQVRLYGSQSEC